MKLPNPIKTYRRWSDRRFAKRIDRAYFREQGGIRRIKGALLVENDGEALQPASVVCQGAILAYYPSDPVEDTMTTMLAKHYKQNSQKSR